MTQTIKWIFVGPTMNNIPPIPQCDQSWIDFVMNGTYVETRTWLSNNSNLGSDNKLTCY